MGELSTTYFYASMSLEAVDRIQERQEHKERAWELVYLPFESRGMDGKQMESLVKMSVFECSVASSGGAS